MALSKLSGAVLICGLTLGAVPALAVEPTPLDMASLREVTTGMDNLALLPWLADPSDRAMLPTAAPVGAQGLAGSDHGLIQVLLQSGQSTMTLERQDSGGRISRIVQTAMIDLPRNASPAVVGVIMQSADNGFGGTGQSATNIAVTATLTGAASLPSLRP